MNATKVSLWCHELLNCAITPEHVFSNGGHILRDFGAKKILRWTVFCSVFWVCFLSNLCVNCYHCISIFRACFEFPPIWREKTLNSLFTTLWVEISWHQFFISYAKKNSSFAEWILWCFGSERLFRIVEILLGGFAVDGRYLASWTRLRWASDVTSY